jgi:2-amino-4-hydroxy-6-hydroxymethyldihydropteridine diphosphokinase
MSHTVYLGLGTNQGDRLANLQAVRAVFTPVQTALAPSVRLLQASPIYETEPWGFLDQPAFLNQALQAETDLPPMDLLAYLKDLEVELGRMPNFRYGPRLIDIDILLYDELVLSLPGLEIPHPRLAERAFVLVPLVDLAPDLRYPGNGRHSPDGRHPPDGQTLQELLKHAGRTGVVLYSQI